MRKAFLITLLFGLIGVFSADAQCPTCTEDTACLTGGTIGICASSMPDGRVGVPYNEEISFAMPSPVTDPGTGITVDLDKIEITGASGVPFGLSWSCNQPVGNNCEYFPSSGDQLGCITFCGTPIAPGNYNVTVFLTATVTAPVIGQISQNEDYEFTIKILPSAGGASSFTYTPTSGCGTTRVDFTNNFPSNGVQGFDYYWDFGNGVTTTAESPPSQTYSPGRYRVIARTVIDTVGYKIEKITVSGTSCNDCAGICLGLPFEGPDLDMALFDNGNYFGTAVYTDYFEDIIQFPLSIPMNNSGLGPLNSGLYSLRFTDLDPSPLPNCDAGAVVFVGQQEGVQTLTSLVGGMTVEVEISHPVIRFNDTIFIDVFSEPGTPMVSYPTDTICDRDTVILESTPSAFYQWYNDTIQIAGAEDSILFVTEPGNYWVETKDQNFCASSSTMHFIDVLPNAPIIVSLIENQGQLVVANLPPNFLVEWAVNGNIIPGENGQFLDPPSEGIYTARIYFGPCENTSPPLNLDWANVAELKGLEWDIYPNPNSGQFKVNLPASTDVDEIAVFDLEGKVIFNSLIKEGVEAVDVDLQNLAAGSYIIGLSIKGEWLTNKLIIMP